MFFTVENKSNWPEPIFKARLKTRARLIVLNYKRSTVEILLDSFLKDEYEKNLKQICLYLIEHCKIASNKNEFTITFPTEELDKLASLVTYGNLTLKGSQILRDALEQ